MLAHNDYNKHNEINIAMLTQIKYRGVPWVQIMENEFECLVARRGDGGHFAEKFGCRY